MKLHLVSASSITCTASMDFLFELYSSYIILMLYAGEISCYPKFHLFAHVH